MENHRGDNGGTAFKATHYRELARSLRVLAATASGDAAQNVFLELAEKYETLADDEGDAKPARKN